MDNFRKFAWSHLQGEYYHTSQNTVSTQGRQLFHSSVKCFHFAVLSAIQKLLVYWASYLFSAWTVLMIRKAQNFDSAWRFGFDLKPSQISLWFSSLRCLYFIQNHNNNPGLNCKHLSLLWEEVEISPELLTNNKLISEFVKGFSLSNKWSDTIGITDT